MDITFELNSPQDTLLLGKTIGTRLKGGEVIELIGDVGAGKTSFVKALAQGLGIVEVVQSPTFTISRVYDSPKNLKLYHYDFYRLKEAGIMREELAESFEDPTGIVALEWDDTVRDILPVGRTIKICLSYTGETSRNIAITVPHVLTYVTEGVEV